MFVGPRPNQGAALKKMRILDRLQRGEKVIDIVFNNAGEVEVNIYPKASSAEHMEVMDYLADEGLLERANENASICRSYGA
jgi:hypothetical protein